MKRRMFESIFRTTRPSKPTRRPRLAIQELETRSLMAGSLIASLNVADGVLQVEGTDATDQIHVRHLNGTVRIDGIQIAVTNGGTTTQVNSVARGQITKIVVAALDGNDLVQMHDTLQANEAPIPTVLQGGSGIDTLIGGEGADTIFGESGVDSILGGAGADVLYGHGDPAASPAAVSVYSGEGNAADSAGGNHGTIQGDVTFVPGRVGQAFDFDGVGDYVDLGSDASLDLPGSMSVSMSVRLDTMDHFKYLFADFAEDGFTSQGSLGAFDVGSNFFWYQAYTDGSHDWLIGSTPIELDQWYHLSAVRDDAAKTVRLFVNGTEEASLSYAGKSVVSLQGSKLLGSAGPSFPADFVDGQIDEVGIYNRALTQTEIQKLNSAASSGLVARYLGEGNANDAVGGNNGTLEGGVSFAPGKVGQAFSFDGVDDGLSTPLIVSYGGGATFESWINTTDPDFGMVMAGGGGSTALKGMGLFVEPGGNLFFMGSKETAGEVNFGIMVPGIADGNFHHVAGTWTGDTTPDGVKLYIDGVIVGMATALTAIDTDSLPLCVGGDATIGYGKFLGLIDAPSVYNRVLTLAEIQALSSGGSASPDDAAGDTLNGQDGDDYLNGGDGNDLLEGNSGTDTLFGIAGNDSMFGHAGNDILWGGEGADSMNGGADADQLVGGEGNDYLDGRVGNDSLFGLAGDDSLFGWIGDDSMNGGEGNDYMDGQQDHDYMDGRNGNDTLIGFNGNDSLFGWMGDDSMFGGAGNDYMDGQQDHDWMNGQEDNDIMIGFDGQDSLFGWTGSDTMYGGAGDDYMDGQQNGDTMDGQEDNDILIGYNGADWLNGSSGNDSLYGGTNNDSLYGGFGNDLLDGQDGDDTLDGQENNDTLIGSDGRDWLNGSVGDDSLYGGLGYDSLYGGFGNDLLDGQQHDDVLDGQEDNDTLIGYYGYDSLYGGYGNDSLYGGFGNDSLYGGFGNDLLDGQPGDDRLEGQEDDDALFGDNGVDALDGGTGNDGLFGGMGINLLRGGGNADRFLTWSSATDIILDAQWNDVNLQFNDTTTVTDRNSNEVDGAGNPIVAPLRYWPADWTEAEIRIADGGLMWAHQLTGNTRFMKPPMVDEVYTTQLFTREGAYIMWNANETVDNIPRQIANMRGPQYAGWNGSTGIVINTYGVSLGANSMQETVVHELAHMRDTESSIWNLWLTTSGWQNTAPSADQASLFNVSGDGRWWYLKTANGTFYRALVNPTDQYSTFNPMEDWTTTWEAYRRNKLGTLNAAIAAAMAVKFDILDQVVGQLSA